MAGLALVYFHSSCVRTAKVLSRLCRCAGSSEFSLVAFMISTIISWAGSIFLFFQFLSLLLNVGLRTFEVIQILLKCIRQLYFVKMSRKPAIPILHILKTHENAFIMRQKTAWYKVYFRKYTSSKCSAPCSMYGFLSVTVYVLCNKIVPKRAENFKYPHGVGW